MSAVYSPSFIQMIINNTKDGRRSIPLIQRQGEIPRNSSKKRTLIPFINCENVPSSADNVEKN